MSKSTVIKSGIWYTVSNVLVKGIAFLTVPIFARMMNKEDFGDYSNFISWYHIAAIIITLNVDSTLISAKYDYKDKFDEYIFSVLFLSFLSCFIWFLPIPFFADDISGLTGIRVPNLYWLAIYIICINPISLFQVKQRYLNNYKSSVSLSLILAISSTLLSIILVYLLYDKLHGRIIGTVAPVVIIGAYFFFYFYKRGKNIVLSYWKYALPICLPFIPHLLSLMLLNAMDKIMINKICGAEANAMYSVAYTGGQIVTLLISAINLAFLPWLGDKMQENKYEDIRKNSKYFILLFAYFSAGLMMVSPEILYILGGNQYLDAINVLYPVSMGCACQFLYMLFVNVEQISKKTKGMALGSVSAAILNYILNLIFIPVFGYTAAAYTTLIGYLWLLLVHMYIVKKIGKSLIYDYRFIFIIVISLMVLSIILNMVYNNLLLRVIILSIYIIPFVAFVVKYKVSIVEFIRKKQRQV